ncbi:dipeptide ABC transporter ATP-binding protein [Enterobacteriaceae bacterium RIT691]|nr:dipeptide ABC transporter ATP-binding protein [Enterobacteriaceae bacterium RIT691]
MDTVLQAMDLKRYFQVQRGLFRPAAEVKALNGVSFSLQQGRTLAVVGESGCGKSTLARQLTLIDTPTSGTLIVDGQNVAQASASQRKAMRNKVQMVFQNPYGSLNPRSKISRQLSDPLQRNFALTAKECEERVRTMMTKVGLRPEHADRYPHMFSGGQRQRIAIARAMILNPKIVIADEPTSALDVSIQAQVLNLFMDLQQEFSTSYVFISHNLSVVEHVAHDVMVMYLGRVVEMSRKEDLYQRPLHPYTRVLLSATPSINPAERRIKIEVKGELPSPLHPPSGCAFHKRCPFATELCRQQEPQLRPIDGSQVACHHIETIPL